jgi:crotonobetainyl-CoA:carnitine CoA-transferase CaiB-like acyl-CoA transferase
VAVLSAPVGVLDGIKVLDFGRYVAGPYCAALLGDLGADVVRVERVGGGEDRFVGPVADDGAGALFLEVNRGKRGLALDPSTPDGAGVVQRLLGWADVVVANLPPAGLAALGVDEASVRAVNPTAVLTTVDAFGTTGPYAGRLGFDGVAQAMSGSVYLSGTPGAPTKAYVPWVDFSTAAFAALGTVAALYWRRDHAGEGQLVEAALLRTALTVAGGPLIEQAVRQVDRRAVGNRSHLAAPYDVCATTDGWVIVQVIGSVQFRRFCALVGEPAWIDDPRFATDHDRVANADPLTERLLEWCRSRSTAEVLAALDEARIPAGPVLSPQQALDDPHVQGAGLLQPLAYGGTTAPVPVTPFALSSDGPTLRGPAPRLGEHTDAVLADVGCSSQVIAALRAAGAVA